MTISFHHHLRNGDDVLPQVIRAIEGLGIKNLVLAPSSLTDSHEIVAQAVRGGTISRIHTSGVRGEIGRMISRGEMEIPVMIHSHGGRARAIQEGRISVDVAFLGAPTCDKPWKHDRIDRQIGLRDAGLRPDRRPLRLPRHSGYRQSGSGSPYGPNFPSLNIWWIR